MDTYKKLFLALKKEVQNTFLQNNLVSNSEISLWKGEDIVKFQEDLFLKTKGRVSEKWFYTYFKSDYEKLPRIDMLNLMSQYIGHKDWEDFKFKFNNKQESLPEKELERAPEKKRIAQKMRSRRTTVWVNYILGASLLFTAGVLGYTFFWPDTPKKRYEFCFIDSDTNNRINQSVIEVTLLSAGIPNYGTTTSGCYQFDANLDSILMVINSPFYRKDSLQISLSSLSSFTQIEMVRDDYSIMLYNYSRGDVEERVKKLEEIIHPDAKIYRFYEGQMQRELITRSQYATFLSVPSTALENFEILETEKNKQGLITMIKFITRENEK